MAAKYFCDGCNRDITDFAKRKKITVNVSDGTTTQAGGQYDLCDKCLSSLKEKAQPDRWPRGARSECDAA